MILPYRGMQTAVACPKCRYVRRPADTAPAWQCPSCGIAYAKFQAKGLVVPPKADEAAPPIAFDGSIWLLLLVNCVALGISHWQKWPLLQLMLLYWAQSLAIGLSYMLRILSLDKYTTEGMKVLGQPVMPTTTATELENAGAREAARPEATSLRSCNEVSGYAIDASDGGIGHVDDFVFEDDSWAIRYLVVDTGSWWSGRRVLIGVDWIHRVSWPERWVAVQLTRERVKSSPEYPQALSREYETVLHRHYGRQGYWPP